MENVSNQAVAKEENLQPGTPEYEKMIQENMKAFWKRNKEGKLFEELDLSARIAEAGFVDGEGAPQVTCEFRLK